MAGYKDMGKCPVVLNIKSVLGMIKRYLTSWLRVLMMEIRDCFEEYGEAKE